MPTPNESALAGRRMLVTGSSGYLASNLIQRLSGIDCEIIRLSRPGATFRKMAGRAKIKDVTGDIREAAVWESCVGGVDVVFHFASQTSVPVAESHPVDDLHANVFPMIRLLQACQRQNVCPLVLVAGTATVVGLPDVPVVEESLPDQPATVYDLHKWMAEQYLFYGVRQKILRGAVLRLFNVYGPGPASSVATRGILNQMIQKALRGENLSVYENGDTLRDYIYVDDVVDAFLAAAGHGDAVNGQHFYIGSGQGVSLMDAFKRTAELCSQKSGKPVSVVSSKAAHPLPSIEWRRYTADSRRFTQATGWTPTVALSEGIDRTMTYFSTHA